MAIDWESLSQQIPVCGGQCRPAKVTQGDVRGWYAEECARMVFEVLQWDCRGLPLLMGPPKGAS